MKYTRIESENLFLELVNGVIMDDCVTPNSEIEINFMDADGSLGETSKNYTAGRKLKLGHIIALLEGDK